MDLNQNTQSLFRRKKSFIILFSILASAVVVGVILRIITPRRPLTSIPKPNLATVKSLSLIEAEIVFSPGYIDEPTPPQGFLQLAENLAVTPSVFFKLFIAPSEIIQGVWEDSGGEKSLALDPYTKRFLYQNASFEGDYDLALDQEINPNQAVTTARERAQFLFPNIPLIPQENKILYLRKGVNEEFEDSAETTSSPNDKSMALVPFSYSADGYPVFINIDLEPPITMWVDSVDNLVRVDASSTLLSPKEKRPVTISPFRRVVQTLKSNPSISVISIISPSGEGFDLQRVKRVEIQKSNFEYRFVEQDKMMVPYYHVFSKMTIEGIEPIDVEFLVSAVEIRTN